MSDGLLLLVYVIPLVLLVGGWNWYRQRQMRDNLAALLEAQNAGLTEPPSLHPVIDEAMCLGCATCIRACPENGVLGLIDGRAKLIEPTHCVGHGACATACPTQAITLVFGTETRGVDIPHVSPQFETNVPGLFIAGELGGMGLIRNAVEQGRQAISFIAARAGAKPAADRSPEMLDVLIIGAGPAGLAASLGAMEAGMHFQTIEQDSLGGTVAHFPRGKLVMTAPADLPMHGRMMFAETSKENLLNFWHEVVDRYKLDIRFHERVEAISPSGEAFVVQTNMGEWHARNVLLAIGRRGTPRQLGVPGEELEKTVYRLADPAQYRGRHVLVVGGGDSALEAALALADEPATTVTLSHRGHVFDRARSKNRDLLAEAEAAGRLKVILQSNVTAITPDRVELNSPLGPCSLENDAVIICVGGILPTGLLQAAGVSVETKYGTA